MNRRVWAASAHTRYFLRRYMPTNILLDTIRTRRRGLKWGVPAMLLAIPYPLIAILCVQLIADGCPGWLHLLVLWAVWNMFKVLWIGPISVVLLIRARVREAITMRRGRPLRAPRLATARGMLSWTRQASDDVRGLRPRSDDGHQGDSATVREHRRAGSIIADCELRGDLRQRQALGLESGCVLPDRVRQLRDLLIST